MFQILEVYRLQNENMTNSVMYKHKLHELEMQMHESKEQLIQAELEKNSALEKVDSLQKVCWRFVRSFKYWCEWWNLQIVDELNEFRKQYEESMAGKDKEVQDKINCLEVEKERVLAESQTYLHHLTDAQNQVIAAREKVSCRLNAYLQELLRALINVQIYIVVFRNNWIFFAKVNNYWKQPFRCVSTSAR